MRFHQLLNEASDRFTREEFKPFIARKLMNSSLIGRVPRDGKRYGITTGSLDEWANYFTALAEVESDFVHSVPGDIGVFEGDSNGLFQLSPNDATTYGFQGGKPFTKKQLQNPDVNAFYAIKIHETLLNGKANWSIKKGPGRYWGPIKRDSKRLFNAISANAGLDKIDAANFQQSQHQSQEQDIAQQPPLTPQTQPPQPKANPFAPPSADEITALNKKFGPVNPDIEPISMLQTQTILDDPSITKMPTPGTAADPIDNSRLSYGQTQRILNDPTFTKIPVSTPPEANTASDDIIKNWKKIEPKSTSPKVIPASVEAKKAMTSPGTVVK